MALALYQVNQSYNLKLCNLDAKVMNLMGKKAKRPFVGILITIGRFNYVAPLSSPKMKHKQMKNSLDFLKIDGGSLGIINFNNMIPVTVDNLIKIDPSSIKINSVDDRNYVNLLNKQLSWINKKQNEDKIINKAIKLRDMYKDKKLPDNIYNRCVNFTLLENNLID